MADKHPGPDQLIRKRITAEKARLVAQIEAQELEILETEERVRRLRDNIKASHDEILKQDENLAALDRNTTEEGEEK